MQLNWWKNWGLKEEIKDDLGKSNNIYFKIQILI